MRSSAGMLACVVSGILGCGGDPDPGDGSGSSDDLPPPAQGFQIVTPTIELAPGTEATYCYYTRIPVSETVGVKQWRSKMTPGSHHMIVYFTQTEQQPEGTLTTSGCGGGLGVWAFSAQEPDVQFVMPPGVGITVPASQPAFIQMHYLNVTDQAVPVHVTLNAETYAPAESYTPASAFITYNSQISIPMGTPGNPGRASAGGSCDVPPDASFFSVSTHAHKQAVHTEVTDGASTVFSSEDWEHPGGVLLSGAPFLTFASGKLSYRCDYENPTGRVIQDGSSAVTDEMCMAVGYFFPATRPTLCLNSTAFPL
ncbi:MAG: hypothetical protein R3B48_19730 [Kofleriaceae bacterium]